ncbi:hypothetical protein [Robiginitomaculum antarcticum]|uniref:hypothetical protein n=1 Tax=Robiginitomaculum antarcticum TaxID=437507 RepID=UPI0003A5B54D|nr:hypothetical protein [Robiginitomaculum antarcticum]
MEGMIFGAAILAVGVGYLVYKKTGDPMMGIMIGAGVGLIDVIILRYVAILTDKNKKK